MLTLFYSVCMIIYKITNTINNKIYIGQTIQSFKNRLNEHKKKMRNGSKSPLYDALRKYGIENFEFKIIDTAVNQQELDSKEIFYIKQFNSRYPSGYNLTDGGAGTFNYRHTQKDKLRMKKLKEGMFLGENNPFYGKHHTTEQKEKWKKDRKGRKLSEEWKLKISKTRKRIKIINIDTGEVFASARDAARYYGKNPDSGTSGTISKVCRKLPKYKTCLGYHFEYYQPQIHDNTVPNIHYVNGGVTTIL